MTRVVPLRRPGLWLGSALVGLLLAALAVSVFRNPNINHAAIAQFQFAPAILQGLRTTVILALLAAAIGVTLGTLLAVMRLSTSPVLRGASFFYTWLLRGTPLLVQILIWGNLALLFTTIGPFDTNTLLTPFIASVLGAGAERGRLHERDRARRDARGRSRPARGVDGDRHVALRSPCAASSCRRRCA